MEENKNYRKVFADRLKELMKNNNLNSAELARQVKIPRVSISNWLNLTRTVQIDALCKLADFFGESVDYLLVRID